MTKADDTRKKFFDLVKAVGPLPPGPMCAPSLSVQRRLAIQKPEFADPHRLVAIWKQATLKDKKNG